MRALRFYAAKDLRVEDVPRPDCGPDEVRLKIAYCGICGTDIHEYLAGPMLSGGVDINDLLDGKPPSTVNKYTGASLPQIMGHEMSGTITEIGRDVTGFQVGQRVTVNAAMDDRHHGKAPCEFCHRGRHNICNKISFYGINAKGGGLADEIVVKPFALVPLPDNVSLKLGALGEPLAVAAHMIRLSGIQAGQDALVLGAGPIGTALAFFLKQSGARQVIVSEVEPSRIAQAKAAGADRVIDPTKEDVKAVVRELTGSGVDVAFEACGLQVTFDAAISCTKAAGTIFNVAIHEKPLELNMNFLLISEKKIMAGNAYTAEDFDRVVLFMSSNGPEIEKFITAIVKLENAIDGGFQEVVNNKAKHNKILIELDGEGAMS